MTNKVYDKGSLPSKAHLSVSFNDCYRDILCLIPKTGIIYDIGSGVGRDAIAMQDKPGSQTSVIVIEPDSQRRQDAQNAFPNRIAEVDNWESVSTTIKKDTIPYIPHAVQNLSRDFNNGGEPIPGDFILCNAVLMFVPQEEQQDFLKQLRTLAKGEANIVVRYRTEDLKPGMTKINHGTFKKQCAAAGFNVKETEPVDDTLGRDFHWHQRILTPQT